MAKKQKIKLNKFEKWFRTLRRFAWVLYRPFFPFKVHGHILPFDNGPYIFVGNHFSLCDVVFGAIAINKPVHFIAKKELFEKGLMKKFVLKCQCIPVNRDGTDVKAVMQAMRYLKGGESVVIYPEGTRNKSNEIFLPFKGGAATISIKTKTPIVPFVQVKKVKFLRRAHVIYGEPIEFSEYYGKRLTEEDIQKCEDELREKMLELYYNLKEITSKKKRK